MQAPQHEHHVQVSPLTYVQIASVLFVLTMAEVGVFYVEALRSVLAPILLVLGGMKFALVVMFYMHLRYDRPLLSWILLAGLIAGAALVTSFALLMRG